MYGSASSSVPMSRMRIPCSWCCGPRARRASWTRTQGAWPALQASDRGRRPAPPCVFVGSCRVVGVDGHVLVREVREEDLGLGTLARQAYLVLDLIPLHRPRQSGLVIGNRGALTAHLDPLDGDVHG